MEALLKSTVKTEIANESEDTTEFGVQTNTKKRTIYGIIFIVIVAVVCVVLGITFSQINNTKQKENQQDAFGSIQRMICGGFENCVAYNDGCNDCECDANGIDECTKMGCPSPELKPAAKCIRCKDGYALNKINGCVLDIYNIKATPEECPDTMIWNGCGTACPKRCGGPKDPVACITVCKAGCECKSDTPILNGDICVTEEQCDHDKTIPKQTCCKIAERPGPFCREGIACCPNGKWSCSIGDAKRYPCGGRTLVVGKDTFGEVCKVPDTCTKGQCKNPTGVCAPLTYCYVNPCEMSTCHTCEANYCGGCYPICKDIKGNIMSTEQRSLEMLMGKKKINMDV